LALVEYYGTGRRKTSTARVHLRQGTGQITVNNRPLDQYFGNEVLKMIIKQPLSLTETNDKFDIMVTVDGGGPSGQAGAIRHGISRALQVYNTDFKNLLPYLLRLGLYLTPILWFADGTGGLKTHIAKYNPLSPIFELWSDAIVRGEVAPAAIWLRATVFSVVVLVVGFVVYVSRERDYAVRI